MKSFTATLVTDGPSDRVLIPIITFLLDHHCEQPHRIHFAEGHHSGSLKERLPVVIQEYPCDVLFVHRDAENEALDVRELQILEAFESIENAPPHIRIIPIRMSESWLLIDPLAIRRAAGNPNGQQPLNLPAVDRIERQDSKDILLQALTDAKDLGTRRLRKFQPEPLRYRVSELIEDFSPLRRLRAFKHFEDQVAKYFETNR